MVWNEFPLRWMVTRVISAQRLSIQMTINIKVGILRGTNIAANDINNIVLGEDTCIRVTHMEEQGQRDGVFL